MATSDPPTVERIFEEAIGIGDVTERAAFLDESCADRPDLRDRVEALLSAHDRADDVLIAPPAEITLESKVAEGPGTTIGRYKLLQRIGEGGFGVVYMAEQERPVRRRVALKIIKLGMDTKQVIARFEAERQALALMDHPNDRQGLRRRRDRHGPPLLRHGARQGRVPITSSTATDQAEPPARRLELFVQVCHAVQHAHQKGIIHRDLKPIQRLVSPPTAETPVPKIIDFGIAKATNREAHREDALHRATAERWSAPPST